MEPTTNNADKRSEEIYDMFLALLKEVRVLNERVKEQQNGILKEKEVLEMLGISEKTMRSYRANGLLAFSKIGNKFFYRLSDINSMLNNARIESDNN